MDAATLLAHRRQKDEFFRSHPQSPLTPEQQAQFTGLAYYDPDPALDLKPAVRPFDEQTDVQLQTTTGDLRWYLRYGEFTFSVDGQTARLTIYRWPHGFFLPVVDAGAGTETYPAGRYLEPVQLEDSLFHIDLNQLYNPYCTYGPGWNCPITPAENRLTVHIRAGEKLPVGPWVPVG